MVFLMKLKLFIKNYPLTYTPPFNIDLSLFMVYGFLWWMPLHPFPYFSHLIFDYRGSFFHNPGIYSLLYPWLIFALLNAILPEMFLRVNSLPPIILDLLVKEPFFVLLFLFFQSNLIIDEIWDEVHFGCCWLRRS